MINTKKGALFHWIIFAVVGAIGLFLVLVMKIDPTAGLIKGSWELGFLEENYLPAEKELFELDQGAQEVGEIVLKNLALTGGFFGNSDCGKLEEINLWNLQEKKCFPNIAVEAAKLAELQLKEKFSAKTFTTIQFDKDRFIGIGGESIINSDFGYYKYQNRFNRKLTHSITDYGELFSLAQGLVSKCRNTELTANGLTLEACLTNNKPATWYFSSCGQEKFFSKEMKVPFCVTKNGLNYQFAIDFEVNDYNKYLGLQ